MKYQYEFAMLNSSGKIAEWANMFGGSLSDPDFYTGAYSRIHDEYAGREAIDWQDLVFGDTAFTQSHNVSVTGGNDQTRFLLSYNYNDQDGIMAKHGYTRNSVRAKINHELPCSSLPPEECASATTS